MSMHKTPEIADVDIAQILGEYNRRELTDAGRPLDAFAEDPFFEPVRIRRHGILPEGVTIAQMEEFAAKVLLHAPPEKSQVIVGPPQLKKRESKPRIKLGKGGIVNGASVVNFGSDSD